MKAVFLDVDDTLVDYDFAARSSLRAVLGPAADYDAFTASDHYERYLTDALEFAAMRESRMADYLAQIGHDGDAVDLERQRYEGLTPFYRLYDDALPCIDQLRTRSLPIGLITNNDSVHQRAKLAAVALDDLFDAIVISGEVGVAKPDPVIFLHACEQLGVEPSEAMHIGDSRTADAAGAAGAGLRGVWLDRNRRWDGEPVDFDVISSLDEVPELLD